MPRASPSVPKVDPLRSRTLRGLGVALSVLAVALVYFHGVRPWLTSQHIPTHIPEDVASFFKGVLVFCGFGLWGWALTRRLLGRPFARATIDSVTATLAALGVVAFVIVDDIKPDAYVHKWEFFHYYLGSKYSEELGYTRLYRCAAVAQSELGPAERADVLERKMRDLETNAVEPAALALEDPDACKSRFSPERWAGFVKDVAWFRSVSPRPYWDEMQGDHGYNPPPVWTMSGRFFGSLFPQGASRTTMSVLASLDPVLYALTFFLVWWAFGTHTCCVALLFWGTQSNASAYFTAGAFLRQDWLFLLVLAACLLRKRYWALGGAALAWSAWLRLFPAIFFAGIVVVALAHRVRRGRFAKHHLRVFAGAAVASLVLVSASAAVVGPGAYVEFARHIEHHGRTPLSNNMGLPVLVSFTHRTAEAAPGEPRAVSWATVHAAAFHRRLPVYLAANVLIVLAFVWTLWRVRTLWMAMALSAALAVSIPQLTCYYYSLFLVPALLAKVSAKAGRAMLFAAGTSALLVVWPRVSGAWEDRYAAQSIVFVALALLLLAGFNKRWTLPKALQAAPPPG